jgi:hypothetical protein
MLRLKDLVISSTVVCLLACGGGAEQTILNRFFTACRAGDNATVASMSNVGFPGECESWDLVSISEPRTQPFPIPELRAQAAEAKKDRDMQFEQGKYFLEDNYDEIGQIEERLEKNPDYEFKGKLGEVKTEWDKIIADRKTLERDVQEINRELEKEIKLTKMSLIQQANLASLQGNLTEKDVQITVTMGEEAKPYQVTLRQYDLADKESDVRQRSRWIIIAIDET